MKTKRILLTFALGMVAILAVALIPGALSGAAQAFLLTAREMAAVQGARG